MARALPYRAVQVRRAGLLGLGLALAWGTRVSPSRAQQGSPNPAPAVSAASPAPPQIESRDAVDRSAELFREGRELLARGALEEACRKFDASLALRRSPGTWLNIGHCRAQAADLLAALEAYRAALELAREQQDREKGQLWSAAAQKEIEALESRLAWITVRVTQADVGVNIDAGPTNVGGGPLPLNPGAHRVRASAPGKRPLELGFELREGERLTLMVPALVDDAASAPSPEARALAPVAGAPGAGAPQALASGAEEGASPRFDWQWPLLLGGGALFAGGAVCGVLAAKQVSQPDYGAAAERQHARTLALTADVLMGAGLVGIGLGIAWPWLSPEPRTSSPPASGPKPSGVAAGCDGDTCELVLSGVF